MRYYFSAARSVACLFACVALFGISSARADEAFIPFLDGLYERGYGALAVDYLKELGARKDLPAEMQAVMDLEMATALRVAAAETLNADESAQRLASAQEHLEKFLKEHADHPRAAGAFVAFGDLASERGDKVLALALRAKGKEPSPLFLDARKDFEEARPKYAKAVEMYKAQFSAAVDEEKKAAEEAADKPVRRNARPQKNNAPTKVEIAESQLLGARFKLGGVDYKLGRTYTDKKDPKRKAAFLAAITEFDAIYQYNRQLRVGLYAHLYHGKAADEMGDQQLALDVYDEVLANAPEGGTKIEAEWENLFAEVERSRLEIKLAEAQVLETKKEQGDADAKRDEVITEADEWVRSYYKTPPQQRSRAFQSMAMLLAETEVAKAPKLTGEDRKKLELHAKQLLKKAAEIPGPYTQDAILLAHTLTGVDEGFTSMKEALAVGDKAASEARWDEAIKTYQAALDIAKTSKAAADQKLVPITRMAMARALYYGGKVPEALDTAEALARDTTTEAKLAPVAAAMAVNAALSVYIESGGKPEALERLLKIADFTVKQWPQLSEADEARLALGKVELANRRPEAAIPVFEAVNPASDHYPSAMYWAGMTRWMLFLGQRQQSGAAGNAAAQAAERQKIVDELTLSIDSARKKQGAGGAPDKGVPDTMLLLAQVYLDGNEASLAVPLLDPLIAGMQKDKPKSLDKFTLGACTAAVRAYIATNEMKKAEGVSTLLMTVGDDVPAVNNVLLKFASTVKNNWKQAEATLIEHKGNPQALKAAEAAVIANKQLLQKIIEPMAKRKQLGLAGMVLVGDTCAQLGLNDKAREEYQLVLDNADDPAFVGNDPHVPAALTRVRSQLIGLLRAEKQYEEALKQVDKLIADNPQALEPRMERGRILQGWSEEDPKHFPEAVAQWTKLRGMLQQSRTRKKPPEYYEVIYNAASCLVEEAKQSKAPDVRKLKASQAEALFKSTKTLSPNLSGPDMVAKFEVLMGQAATLQGRPQQPQAAK